MKRRFLFSFRWLLLLAVIAITSCSKKDLPEETNPAAANAELVSLETARQLAIDLSPYELQGGMAQPGQKKFAVKSIKNHLTISEKNLPAFYIFNYNEGGFIVIAAEKKEKPVMAYDSRSDFPFNNVPPGIALWVEMANEYIQLLREKKIPAGQAAANMWNYYLTHRYTGDKPAFNGRIIDPEPCDPNSESYWYGTTTTRGPLLATTWNQGCGYNNFCPLATGGPCGRAWAGCVATAMVQVMRYWQRPAMYNWAAMPNNTGGNDVSLAMSDAGNAVNMSYGANASGAYTNNVPNALKNTFGYFGAAYTGYNSTTVANEIVSNRPVILDGCHTRKTFLGLFTIKYEDCHAWVCDGTQFTNYCWGTYSFMHMNWGWGGSYNGWYDFYNWNIPGANLNFKYNNNMVYDIRG